MMLWRTERKKLITAVLVVGGLYAICMIIAKHSLDYNNAMSWSREHPSQLGPVLVAWGLGALGVLGLWGLIIYLNFRRKHACSRCGWVTKSGGWVTVTDPAADGGIRQLFLCSADLATYQRNLRLAEAERMGLDEEHYRCPVCRAEMAKVPEEVGIEAFPINRCTQCGAVLVTGERDRKRLAYANHLGYMLGYAKAQREEDDAFATALIAGAVAGSVASSIGSSNSC